jgi:hypothetical protein
MDEISIRTVTGWFKDSQQKKCLVRKWLAASAFKNKPQWSQNYWIDTLDGLAVMREDYNSVCDILDDFFA